MIANHIHDALAQVKKLQEFILEKRLFKGYSGKARIASGLVAFIAAVIMASDKVPKDPYVHLNGWAIVATAGVFFNYGSLLYWFLFDREVRRNPIMLKPALDAVPALMVGGALTLAIITADKYELLFGTWMCLYGLAQVAYRQSLPKGIYLVGTGYILAGIYCLLSPAVSFCNPWPMGIVFLAGEIAGGAVLMKYAGKAVQS